MTLMDTLISSLPSTEIRVERIITGRQWRMVVGSNSGIARVPAHMRESASTAIPPVTGKPLTTLFPMARSSDPAEAAVGVAAVNAALTSKLGPSRSQPTGIPRAGGKTVGLVGDFPFAAQLKEVAADVVHVERENSEYILPGVDIAILSGAAIVDHSLERLLALSATCYTIVFGPSTPLSPVLFDFGADQLVGVNVKNHGEAARWITADRDGLMECPGLKSVVLRK
jgi:uncharacterized protein (DUF4213/DUF364 family)